MSKFQAPNSKCIWYFDWKDGNIYIRLNTGPNIIYSEYAFYGGLELAIVLNEETYIWIDGTKLPHLSTDNRIYYYSGKIQFKGKCPQYFLKGILSFKECNPYGRCKKMKYIEFSHEQEDWKFWEVKAPLFDENERRIPHI